MDHKRTAARILDRIGGKNNVNSVFHCITRLRFSLKDESLADDRAVESIDGVMNVIKKGGQYQVVIGPEVDGVFREVEKLCGLDSRSSGAPEGKKQSIVSTVLDVVSGCMGPVIPAIIGSAMVKVLLTLLPMAGLLENGGQTYMLLQYISDGAFYFLPVLIAIAAAQKFRANTYYAATLALIVLLPGFTSFMNAAAEAGEAVRFFGIIPVTNATYAYSVMPIILGVWFLSYVERLVDNITPGWTKNFLKPLLVLLITGSVFIVAIGPLGAICGEIMTQIVQFIYQKMGFVAVGLVACIYPFLVMAGMHYAFNPVRLSTLATAGSDAFIGIAELCSNIAEGAAALAVFVKAKDKDLKQVAGSSSLSALVGGITEPALYGVSVRLKKPLWGACIGGLAGGMVGGLLQCRQYVFGSSSLTGIPLFADGTAASLVNLLIMLAVDIGVTFIATWFLWTEEMPKETGTASGESETEITVTSPVEGKVIALAEVGDETFNSGTLGAGLAVIPKKGEVYASFSGTITTFFHTGHAVGITGDNGVELLIHVGLETVNLNGKYFKAHKKEGDRVQKGDLLLTFDFNAIKKAGYDTVTPVIVTNSADYDSAAPVESGYVTRLDPVLKIVRQR